MEPTLPGRKAENYWNHQSRSWAKNKDRYLFLLRLLVGTKQGGPRVLLYFSDRFDRLLEVRS